MVMTFNPFGLSLVSYKGGKYKGTTSPYPLFSGYQAQFDFNTYNTLVNVSGIGQGDLVQMTYGSGIRLMETPITLTGVTAFTAGYSVWGVFNAVTYTDITGTDKELPFWASGTQTFNGNPAMATIDDVPNNVYQMQANNPLSINVIGANYGFKMLTNGANPQTGQSTAFLDTGQAFGYGAVQNASNMAPLKIIGLADLPNNNWTDPYPIVNVVINNHIFKYGTPST